eukprot:CAMPEP_0185617776 /NCGR_PEP_ID=MMETSP0436-20130131/44700_1 /TAXON_ID=626734 ORGANISM="Favella taraikaensis, Strain Fe Narragansett Bay" /NCGR_SAMPLE_ID=MMETSP0436 /ASSEMBLY_ACC=CAM_ASM_000390 /LENGTH=111 /DNA_ID=CAMNT_0028255737 /DNA_START=779 /DNA_END=1115 /DNA_ORIENTATION=-
MALAGYWTRTHGCDVGRDVGGRLDIACRIDVVLDDARCVVRLQANESEYLQVAFVDVVFDLGFKDLLETGLVEELGANGDEVKEVDDVLADELSERVRHALLLSLDHDAEE